MSALKINNIQKKYGSLEILKEINIDVKDGEFLVLVGPSGCGKSTLLNMIAGLESITAGDMYIGGKRVNNISPKDRNIAMVFQSYALYPTMTVRKNISFALEIQRVPKKERAVLVDKVAKMLQIEALMDRKPAQLSGGQRQRVAMGRALARNPAIFLFDEPLSNLDAKLRVGMRTEIKKLHQKTGTTIVYVTHDQIEAMTLADRIAVMKDGILQQIDTPQAIYDDPKNMFVAGFIGSPSMNFIPCKVVKNGAGQGILVETDPGCSYIIPFEERQKELSSRLGEKIILGVRPEHLTTPSQNGTAKSSLLEAIIQMNEPTGPDTLSMVHINGKEVIIRVNPEESQAKGNKICLKLDLSKAVFFDENHQKRIA